MAEPGDPQGSESAQPQAASDDQDHDALVGFVSAASLAGRRREPEATPAAPTRAETVTPAPEREADLFDPPEPQPQPVTAPAPAQPGPFERSARPGPVDALRDSLERRKEQPAAPMSLYAVYVLILLAVPTLGVSAVLALLAVTGRDGPEERLAASHFLYQRRTLWIAAGAVVLGGLLVIVNIGVFVLFLLALWVLARGVFGVMRLKAGRPIDCPRSWLF
jgi:uncharacterized membrane protein